ncbi:hypothetical protein EB796_019400 [Bugula neritina]|uniref:Uncharacterized protein n=1 Tax=Bugula neritina TaxID=10212 RepID=A0A7J7J7V8_BUGNE|nr:hypothetical protein EB796_019400 [Bugula neritina]
MSKSCSFIRGYLPITLKVASSICNSILLTLISLRHLVVMMLLYHRTVYNLVATVTMCASTAAVLGTVTALMSGI